jgi:hypothetical protein
MGLRVLGKVTVPTGGTPERVTKNLTDPTARIGVQSIFLQALPSNTGIVYVRVRGNPPADDRVTMAVTFGLIPAPTSATTGPFPSITISEPMIPAGFNLADLYLDVGVNGDGALVSAVTG